MLVEKSPTRLLDHEIQSLEVTFVLAASVFVGTFDDAKLNEIGVGRLDTPLPVGAELYGGTTRVSMNARFSLRQASLAQAIADAFHGSCIVNQHYPGNVANAQVRSEPANFGNGLVGISLAA